MLGTKVAENWECFVMLVQNVVDSIDMLCVGHHDVFTWPGRKLASVSREAWRTCAFESSLIDVTYLIARAAMLTGGGVTALVMTGWFRAGLVGNTLENRRQNCFKKHVCVRDRTRFWKQCTPSPTPVAFVFKWHTVFATPLSREGVVDSLMYLNRHEFLIRCQVFFFF